MPASLDLNGGNCSGGMSYKVHEIQSDTFWNITVCNNVNYSADTPGNQIALDAFSWSLVIVYILTFLLGLVGNVLVCFAIWRNKKMRTVTNIFLVNLAATDLGVIIVCLPPALVADVTDTWFLGTAFCKIHLFFSTVSIAVSVMTLCAISVERWYAICHPLRFHSTLRRTRFTIIAIWLISICVAVPEVVSAVVVCPRNDTILHSYCYPGLMSDEMIQSFQVSIMVVFYFIPLCLMGYTYSHIAVVLWRQKIPGLNFEGRHFGGELSRSTNYGSCDHLEGRRKAARMLVMVVVLFAICFLPSHTLNIIRYSVGLEVVPQIRTVALLAHWAMFFNSCVNPVIYNFFSGKFRKEFLLALKLCFGCGMNRSVQQSSVML